MKTDANNLLSTIFYNTSNINKLTEIGNPYSLFFENTYDGIFIYDIQLKKIIDFNEKFVEIIKQVKEEEFCFNQFLDKNHSSSSSNKLSKSILSLYKNILSKNNYRKMWPVETHLGEIKCFEISGYCQVWENKKKFIFIIVKDQTYEYNQQELILKQVKELEEKNEKLNKYIQRNLQLENFAYVASHDLKTPVRTIVSFAQLLNNSMEEKMTNNELSYLSYIINGGLKLQNLLDDMLTYSQIDHESQEPHLINFNTFIESIELSLKTAIQTNNALIVKRKLPAFLLGQSNKLRQVFENIISNAIHYRRKNIPLVIEIDSNENDKEWVFSIKDNGLGIDKEYYESIFLLFKKLGNFSQNEGTGAGLAICKKIIEQHGGEIWVESIKNESTTFYFSILKKQN